MKASPDLARSLTELRAILKLHRDAGLKIGFVPTMGALHDGHLSLVERAQAQSDVTVVSIFVNPTQFAPGEDLESYPRTEAQDIARLAALGTDIVYLPRAEDMYPDGSKTNVRVEEMSDLLDGVHRPHFFYGVATVVARLFIHVQPDVAVFGEKDFQQLQIIRRMVRDLGFAIDIIGGATIRDCDGLAQSSRNAYLSGEERRRSNALSAALHRAVCRIEAGGAIDLVRAEAETTLLAAGFERLDYISIVDPERLQTLSADRLAPGQEARILAAAWMGGTRLIDNMAIAQR
ncbi:MAG: pantoate--beta-alanine ligase [Pseudomonadota bacterium]